MRNIMQYPLDASDVMRTLENAQKDYEADESVGGVDGLVFFQLMNFLKDENNMNLVLEFKPGADKITE